MDTARLDECFFANRQAKETLAAFINGGRIVHGLLITGERGLGKRTFARLAAAAFVCGHENPPCLSCHSCKKALSGSHPDITVYSGEGAKARSFHIDTVRELRRKAMLKPNESARKVLILAGCDTMTVQAQNALLKLLEEPPEDTVLILTASSRDALLETVLSRLSEIRLLPLTQPECADALLRLHPELDRPRAEEAAALGGGNLGRALELFGPDAASSVTQLARAVVEAAAQGDYALALALHAAAGDRTLFAQMLDRLMLVCRDILAAKLGSASMLSGEVFSRDVLGAFTKARVMRTIDCAAQARRMLLQNAQPSLVASWLCAHLYG